MNAFVLPTSRTSRIASVPSSANILLVHHSQRAAVKLTGHHAESSTRHGAHECSWAQGKGLVSSHYIMQGKEGPAS
ncbi:hypothetical protein ACSS6W_001578 [Trichoderma asperelloides]